MRSWRSRGALARALLLLVPLLLVGAVGAAAAAPRAPALAGPGAPSLAVPGDEVDFEAVREEALEKLVGDLLALSRWCNGQTLFLERNRVWEAVIHFDPKNEEAREGLEHTRDANGEWVAVPSEREFKNFDKKALQRLPEKRDETVRPYAERMLGYLEENAAEVGPQQRLKVYRDILAVDPDNARVRELLGEVRLDEEWVLVETAAAKDGRAFVRDAIKESAKNVPKDEKIEPDEVEASLGIDWNSAVSTGAVRVLTSGERKESKLAIRALHACAEVFSTVFATPVEHHAGFTVYLLAEEGDKQAFLDKHPAIRPADREFLEQLVGSGVPGTANAVRWDEEQRNRLDGAVRHTLGQFMTAAFGLRPEQGWIWEGFGLYLTRELVGTRLTWYIVPDRYGPGEAAEARAELIGDESDWMNAAYERMTGEAPPALREIVQRPVNKMSVEDVLLSYALAAYLLEGRREDVTPILRRVGKGEAAPAVLEDVLGTPLEELQKRLVRWLGERR